MTLIDIASELEALKATNEDLRIKNETLLASAAALSVVKKRFDQLLDSIPEPCLITDLAGRIHAANMALLNMLNVDLASIQGKTIAALLPTPHRKRFQKWLQEIQTKDALLETDLSLKPHKSTESLSFKASALLLRNLKDEPTEIRWVLTLLPADAAKATALAELKNLQLIAPSTLQNKVFRNYMAAHHTLGVTHDPRDLMEFLAKHSCEMAGGYSYISLLSPDKKMLIPVTAAASTSKAPDAVRLYAKAKSQKVAGNVAEQALTTQKPSMISKRKQPPKGVAKELFKQGPTEMMILPLRARENVLGVLTVMRNPGDPAFSANELQMVQNLADHAAVNLWTHRLEASGSAIDNAAQTSRSLAFAMCRNFQGPLYAVIGYAGMLEEQLDKTNFPEAYSDVQEILKSATYLNDLVSEVFELLRAELGLLHLVPERINVSEFMKSIELEVGQRSSTVTIQHRGSAEELVGVEIKTDISWARQAIAKLLLMIEHACGSCTVEYSCESDDFVMDIFSGPFRGISLLSNKAAAGNGFDGTDVEALDDSSNVEVQLRLMLIKRICEVLPAKLQLEQTDSGCYSIRIGFSYNG